MLFTEIIFAPFLCLTFLGFYLCRHYSRLQILFLLTASYVFYGWWDVRFLGLIVFSSGLDYWAGHRIAAADTTAHRKFYLSLSLIGNLGLLGYFKYAGFFQQSLIDLLTAMGMQPEWAALDIVLPVGISFYTFQSLSYSLDIYSRRIEPERSLIRFLFYVSAFPQLVAGPIVRAREFLPQLRQDLFANSSSRGIFFVMYGLAKKIWLADPLGARLVDPVFAQPAGYTSLELLLAVYGYAFQIFFDFSAYSDIAIGLGLIFGLTIPVNFLRPYLSASPSEFWRRWHITLSSWLRDYLYIPLGGNRVAPLRHMANLMIVMLLGGLWHGANWTFIFWGGLHGLYLILYRMAGVDSHQPRARGFSTWISIGIFFHLTCLAWIFFRSPDIRSAFMYLHHMFSSFGGFQGLDPLVISGTLIAGVIVHGWCEKMIKDWSEAFTAWPWWIQSVLVYLTLVAFSIWFQSGVARQAFIYFQF